MELFNSRIFVGVNKFKRGSADELMGFETYESNYFFITKIKENDVTHREVL